MQKLLLGFLFYLLLQGTAYARFVLITWVDNSEDEEGFVIERAASDNCVDGWEVIAYAGINQNSFVDIHVPGACYRVAAYNRNSLSPYSNTSRVQLESES